MNRRIILTAILVTLAWVSIAPNVEAYYRRAYYGNRYHGGRSYYNP